MLYVYFNVATLNLHQRVSKEAHIFELWADTAENKDVLAMISHKKALSKNLPHTHAHDVKPCLFPVMFITFRDTIRFICAC